MKVSLPVTLKTESIGGMTDEQFFWFCQENESLRFERNSNGEILLMAPTGFETESYNLNIAKHLANWNDKKKLGVVVGNNAGFTLSNNAVRCPDAAFISNARLSRTSKEDRKRFIHICPEFVIEILSPSDSVKELKEKMEEWIANGCLLAWMIDPRKKTTMVFRANGEKEKVGFDKILSGEKVLPGFKIKMKTIFSKSF